jgi:hypothetical protein
MRSIKLRPALAAAALSLALAPSAALAAKHSKPNAHRHASPAGCHLTIFAEPRVVTGGEPVQVFGQVGCPGAGASAISQAVTIYERSKGTPGFKVVGTATTGPGGFYSMIPPTVTTDSFFYARAVGARSANRPVRVAPQVTLATPPTAPDGAQLRTGKRNAVTFAGSVSPADAGAEVLLQRENSASFEEWVPIQRGVVSPGGTFSMSHRFIVPGDANIRVIVRPHGNFSVRGVSNTLSYEISQAQNPKLTLNASADPISYGQPVTLSGILAGGANQKVTLLSHPRGQKAFTKVTEATTNGSGEYTFAEKPLQNTYYRVTSGAINSAVLFEGVKYVLTAAVSATTIPAGQSLTFSGTVTPDHVGHVVYLERENLFGGGFHVADVGTVTSASTYSIGHFVFGSGKQVFRIKVPGDPENQAISSTPFAIVVTPSPAALLHPAPAGKLPGEGKV